MSLKDIYCLELRRPFCSTCHACEELESDAKCSRIRGDIFINVKNTHVCYIIISRRAHFSQNVKYWYEIRNVLVECTNLSGAVRNWYQLFTV